LRNRRFCGVMPMFYVLMRLFILMIKMKGMVSPQLAWRVGLNYAIYY